MLGLVGQVIQLVWVGTFVVQFNTLRSCLAPFDTSPFVRAKSSARYLLELGRLSSAIVTLCKAIHSMTQQNNRIALTSYLIVKSLYWREKFRISRSAEPFSMPSLRPLLILILLCFYASHIALADETEGVTANNFVGNWGLAMPGGAAGWLTINEANGELAGELWTVGMGRNMSDIAMEGDELTFFRNIPIGKPEYDGGPPTGNKVSINHRARVEGDRIALVMELPTDDGKIEEVAFQGKRLSSPPPRPDLNHVELGAPIELFNGVDLSGWRLSNPKQLNGWKVENGELVNTTPKLSFDPFSHYGNLQTEQEFEDFNLTLEFNVPAGGNSGVYLRGRYEAQVTDRDSRMQGIQGVGAIFSRIPPSVNAGKPGGEWQTYDITLVNQHVTVILNGTKVIDNEPIVGCTNGALSADDSAPGPIYLQGDHTAVRYRNIVLRPVLRAAEAKQSRPNIVLIMADDVGIEGLGCYGGISYRTPALDALAEGGLRFTHAYSQPLCTPTRVQLMTGKYNHRNWKFFGILDPQEKTFGHYLSAAGYATAIFGKWQLQSYDPPDFPGAERRRGTGMHPKDAGFDEYALFHALHTEDKGSRYANPSMLEGVAGKEGTLKKYQGKFGEDLWVAKTIDFLERHRDQPAFVYYPMALPHWPFVPTPISDDWDPEKPVTESLAYATDMIEYMDKAVGNLISGLDSKGLRDNTLVVFYSDNGTHLQVTSKMSDGRTIGGGKGSTRQTGIHVPLIVSWPGHVQPAVSSSLIDASDFLPTLLELAGGHLPAQEICDGISFAPELLGRTNTKRESVFFWYDPRPGDDKLQFSREVFALDHHYKYFRDGRLLKLTERPLEELPIDLSSASAQDRAAMTKLKQVIASALDGVTEPPLVNAFGELIDGN